MSDITNAIKKIYPNIEGGFVYWKTKQDGESWESPIDGLVWKNSKYTKPSWEAIQAEFLGLDLLKAKDSKIDICKEYLQATDWYCLRHADRGLDYPDEVKNKREQARGFQSDIKALTKIEEVNAFDISAIL